MFAARKKPLVLLAAVLALGLIGSGIGTGLVVATGGDDDPPITGAALQECSAAALRHAGGGTVTETEVGDDGAAYGVEIRLDDGSQVEVSLDENCKVIVQEVDDDGPSERVGPNDD